MTLQHTAMFRVYADADGNPAEYSTANVPLKPKHHLPVNIQGVQKDDFAMILPPPSKADEFGVIWGSKPVYLPVRFTQDWCAALRLSELELLLPASGKARSMLPLFLTDALDPFTFASLDKMLDELKFYGLPEHCDPSVFSYHSFRIRLATSLGNARSNSSSCTITDSHIQSLCRWVSPKSLATHLQCHQLLTLDLSADLWSRYVLRMDFIFELGRYNQQVAGRYGRVG